jgi:hypothetical protein
MTSQPTMFGRADPLDLKIIEELLVRHSDPPSLLDRELVRLDLGRRIDVAQFGVEERLVMPKLVDVAELVDDVEVDVTKGSGLEVAVADDQVAVDVARPHVAEPGGEKFHFLLPQDLQGLLSEKRLDGGDLLESAEEPEEGVEFGRRISLDSHLELRFEGHRRRGPVRRTVDSAERDFVPPYSVTLPAARGARVCRLAVRGSPRRPVIPE